MHQTSCGAAILLLTLLFACGQRKEARQENDRVEVGAHAFMSFSSSKQGIGRYNPNTQVMTTESTARRGYLGQLEYDEYLKVEDDISGQVILSDTVHQRAGSDDYPFMSYESNRRCWKSGLLQGTYRLRYHLDRLTKTCIIYGVADSLHQEKQGKSYPAVVLYLDE